jgi:hypothetical protein
MSSTSELPSFAARMRELMASPEAMTDPLTFGRLALQLFALQFEHNAPYRRFCEARAALPGAVAHWADIPAIPTSAFKEWELSCLPAEERTTVFHSSGTTAQRPSRHFQSKESLALYEASLLAGFEAQLQFPIANCRLAILTPPPAQAPHSSLVHMFASIRRKWSRAETPYVGRLAENGGWELELEAAVRLLREAQANSQPLLLFGTAFSFVHLLDHLAAQGLQFALPSGSGVLETGGYKGRSRAMPKAALHALISQRLSIPRSQIVCEYGMSELSSQAYDSRGGCFQFPPWARVQITSPETGREVGEGETGLIRIFDLANVYSVMAIQTEDLGVRCGDGFLLAGRAALAEPRGCSLMAP